MNTSDEEDEVLERLSALEHEVDSLRRTLSEIAKATGVKVPSAVPYTKDAYVRISEDLGLRPKTEEKDD